MAMGTSHNIRPTNSSVEIVLRDVDVDEKIARLRGGQRTDVWFKLQV